MKLFSNSFTTIRKHTFLFVISFLTLTSCSNNNAPPSTLNAPTPSSHTTTTPPPHYSSEHIRRNLIPANKIANNLRKIKVIFQGAKDGNATSCSLSSVKFPGEPEVIARQFIKSGHPPTETHYVQLIARYENAQGADSAFQRIRSKSRSCPPKQNVPAKRTERGTTMLPHKDTWKTEEGMVSGWRHLRGHEQRVFPRSMTKYNVYFTMYDYAVRGNVIVCTYYSERREPGESGGPIAKRATEILTEQLQMFG